MGSRDLEIILQYAKDLNQVNLLMKMDVYAVVSISGGGSDSKQKTKTPVDHENDADPVWNFAMKFKVEEEAMQQNRLTLDFKLICERALGDKEVGEVNVPIKELFDAPAKGDGKRFLSYQVRKPSRKPKGQITFSFQFGEISGGSQPYAAESLGSYQSGKVDEPPPAPVDSYTAPVGYGLPYPPPGPPPSYGVYPPPAHYPAAMSSDSGRPYPPPPSLYPHAGGYPPASGFPSTPPVTSAHPQPQPGYGYPPPPGYGYPPPHPGYGYPPHTGYGYPPPPVQQPAKKNNLGLGLGAGVLGGAIGGLLVGDIISEAVDFDLF